MLEVLQFGHLHEHLGKFQCPGLLTPDKCDLILDRPPAKVLSQNLQEKRSFKSSTNSQNLSFLFIYIFAFHHIYIWEWRQKKTKKDATRKNKFPQLLSNRERSIIYIYIDTYVIVKIFCRGKLILTKLTFGWKPSGRENANQELAGSYLYLLDAYYCF